MRRVSQGYQLSAAVGYPLASAIMVLAYELPLTLSQLESIRAELFAEDVPIDHPVMVLWTTAQARSFFEGGEGGPVAAAVAPATEDLPEPAAATESALLELLRAIPAANELRPIVGARSLEGWCALLDSRPTVLAELKRLGVSSLSTRQAFTNALGRHTRQKAADAAAAAGALPPAAAVPPPPPIDRTCATSGALPMAVEVSAGLCNRLRVVLSHLVVARRLGRPLLIVWPLRAECTSAFEAAFEPLEGATFVESLEEIRDSSRFDDALSTVVTGSDAADVSLARHVGLHVAGPPHDFHPEVIALDDALDCIWIAFGSVWIATACCWLVWNAELSLRACLARR